MIMIAGTLIFLTAIVFVLYKRKKIRIKKKSSEPKEISVDINYEPWEGELWDMHCHILPGVDDGADGIQTALDMIWKEIRQGVTDIMLTPHYVSGKTDPELIQKSYMDLLHAVNVKEYNIRLYLGNEVLFGADTIEALRQKKALTLAGSSYVLVEFDYNIPYPRLKNDLLELQMAGYRPILAHLERYGCLLNHEDRVEELVHQGILMQANAGSFVREGSSRFLTELAAQEKIHFIGTDSHNMDWRPPRMSKPFTYLRNKLPEELVRNMAAGNPNKVIHNKFI